MRSPAERQRLYDELLTEGAFGGTPRQWLNDEDVGVRGCAALASSLSGDPEATHVLFELARSPRAFDVALGYGTQAPALRHFAGPPRWTLIEQACSRAGSPDDLWVAAAVAAPRAFRLPRCPEIGPYLRVIFACGWPQTGTASSVQRAVARHLAQRTELWQRNDTSRAATLGPLGLPDDRAAWQELASSHPAGEPTAADIVVVEERVHAIRMRPEMYLNLTERDDPRLPGLIVEALIDAFSADDQSADWELIIESDLKFALTVYGVALNADSSPKRRSQLTDVLTSTCPRNVKEAQIGVAAAWTRIHAYMTNERRQGRHPETPLPPRIPRHPIQPRICSFSPTIGVAVIRGRPVPNFMTQQHVPLQPWPAPQRPSSRSVATIPQCCLEGRVRARRNPVA